MTIENLKAKHEKLKKLDGGGIFKSATYKTFGSNVHRYKFNSRLSEYSLQSFEQSFSITLPADYKNFLTQIGNGGSGPYYGLFPLSDWNFELDITDNSFLSSAFPHLDKWNLERDFDTNKEDYYESEEFQKWGLHVETRRLNKSIQIYHYGNILVNFTVNQLVMWV